MARPRMLQIELTEKCQLACTHCFAGSGPDRGHGDLTTSDYTKVITEAAELGIPRVQLIGGEPTLRPDLVDLLDFSLDIGRQVEVYSNLVRVTDPQWAAFARPGVTLATSWYSDQPGEHQAVTQRDTWARTLTNIKTAVACGIPLRAGIIRLTPEQRVAEAKAQLHALGVEHVGVDDVRGLGRAAADGVGDVSQLCGNCGTTVVAVLPNGAVAACPMSRFLARGDVRRDGLAALLTDIVPAGMPPRPITNCGPDNDGQCHPCEPSCIPGCDPGVCSPHSSSEDDGLSPRVLASVGGGCKPEAPCPPDNDGGDCRPASTDWDPDE